MQRNGRQDNKRKVRKFRNTKNFKIEEDDVENNTTCIKEHRLHQTDDYFKSEKPLNPRDRLKHSVREKNKGGE